MKWANGILGVLFLVFAVVQYNDPDPWKWILLYAAVGAVLLFAVFGKRNQWVPVAGILVCVIWLGTLIPEFVKWIQMGMPSITETMKTEEPHIEYTREFLGLAVCMAALIFNWRKARQISK
jgi:hypothetical protein